MSQIHLFMGTNKYAMQKEKIKWIKEFVSRHGSENLSKLDASQTSILNLCGEVQIAPFIAEKRLFIIDGIPRGKKEDIEKLINSIHPNVIMLFILETENNKKYKMSVAATAISAIANVKQFPLCSHSQLIEWISNSIREFGAEGIEKDALSFLLDKTGDNQEKLETELSKFSLFAHGRKINLNDVLLLTLSADEREAWQIMEFIGAGKHELAVIYADSLLDRGYSPQSLWSTFLWMVSLLVQLVAILESGESDYRKIAYSLHAHVSSIRSLLPFAKSIQRNHLLKIVQRVSQADISLKTGGIRAPVDSQEELLALIDTSMMAFAK